VLAKKLLTREQLDQILQPEVLTQPQTFGTATTAAQTDPLSVHRDQTD
jgi:aspartate ammonia-lyase